MDGILVDSEPLHLKAYQELLHAFGHQYFEEDNRQFLGQKDIEVAASLIERFKLAMSPGSFVREKERILHALLSAQAKPQPGVLELLKQAKSMSLPAGLASSATMPTIELTVDILGIRDYFATLTSGDEVKAGKPAPDVFLLAARRLAVPPAFCLVIEDTQAGVVAARAAGMSCVAVPCASTKHEDHSQADERLESLVDINLAAWTDPGQPDLSKRLWRQRPAGARQAEDRIETCACKDS